MQFCLGRDASRLSPHAPPLRAIGGRHRSYCVNQRWTEVVIAAVCRLIIITFCYYIYALSFCNHYIGLKHVTQPSYTKKGGHTHRPPFLSRCANFHNVCIALTGKFFFNLFQIFSGQSQIILHLHHLLTSICMCDQNSDI